MWRNTYGGLVEPREVGIINSRARRFGFREDEMPDLQQEIVPELIKADFDPELAGGAKRTTFVIAVVDHHLKKILRDRNRAVRRVNHEACPLDGGGVLTERCVFRMEEEGKDDLRVDLEPVMADLPEMEREICEGLMRGETQVDIAGSLKRSRTTLFRAVGRLREKFQRSGLDIYL